MGMMKEMRIGEATHRETGILDGYKELTPVIYGKDAIKYLYYNKKTGNESLFEMHWHERMEILLVVSGSLELNLTDRSFILHAGEAAVLTPGMLHEGRSGAEGLEYHTFMFDVEKLCNGTAVSEKYLKPIYWGKTGFVTLLKESEVLCQIERLAACFGKNKAENPLLAMGIVYEILGLLYIHALDSDEKAIKGPREFGEVLDYVNQHFCEKLSAKSLSEQFNYNETYFCRRFKSLTGFTVMNYIQTLRMEEAQRLLERGDEEIRVIARKCGFADTCYFSNCFRKHFGYAPTTFRSLHAGEEV